MNKTLVVAWREFTSTVLTKGFLIGVVMAPAIMLVAILVIPLLINNKPPPIDGSIAVVDPTGVVYPRFEKEMSPEALEADAKAQAEEAAEKVNELVKDVLPPQQAKMAQAATEGALAANEPPKLRTERLPDDADVESQKQALRVGEMSDGSRLALAVIAPNAVAKGEGGTFGAYELFVRERLDDRVQDRIRNSLGMALIDARLEASGFDPANIREVMWLGAVDPKTVTREGGERNNDVDKLAQFLIPFAFIMLLWISAFTGGQYLLTTTVEEKSNRIMEVLLSAVSPLQLMVGKIVGQMGVGLLILLAYAGLGVGAMSTFKMLGLLQPENLGYLVIYFFLAFFVIASLMAAVGSAVTDVHEAQSLIGPVIMVMVIPMILWMPITRNPDSALATGLSFAPMLGPFVMVIRIAASPTGIPFWQIAGSIAVGALTAAAAAWAAAKVFRIGVLMYGKPPNFATMIKWIRMA